jgi:hypothetical protein
MKKKGRIGGSSFLLLWPSFPSLEYLSLPLSFIRYSKPESLSAGRRRLKRDPKFKSRNLKFIINKRDLVLRRGKAG